MIIPSTRYTPPHAPSMKYGNLSPKSAVRFGENISQADASFPDKVWEVFTFSADLEKKFNSEVLANLLIAYIVDPLSGLNQMEGSFIENRLPRVGVLATNLNRYCETNGITLPPGIRISENTIVHALTYLDERDRTRPTNQKVFRTEKGTNAGHTARFISRKLTEKDYQPIQNLLEQNQSLLARRIAKIQNAITSSILVYGTEIPSPQQCVEKFKNSPDKISIGAVEGVYAALREGGFIAHKKVGKKTVWYVSYNPPEWVAAKQAKPTTNGNGNGTRNAAIITQNYLFYLILTGKLPVGQWIGRTQDIADKLHISRDTVRTACQSLVKEGVLGISERRPGDVAVNEVIFMVKNQPTLEQIDRNLQILRTSSEQRSAQVIERLYNSGDIKRHWSSMVEFHNAFFGSGDTQNGTKEIVEELTATPIPILRQSSGQNRLSGAKTVRVNPGIDLSKLQHAASQMEASASTLVATTLPYWKLPIAYQDQSPVQVQFQLEKSESLSGGWKLKLYVQRTDMPNIRVDISEALAGKNPAKLKIESKSFDLQHYVMSCLKTASTLLPELQNFAQSDDVKREIVFLSSEQVIPFIQETAPILEQIGFSVKLPKGLQAGKVERVPVSLKLQVKSDSEGNSVTSAMERSNGKLLSLEQLLKVGWSVEIGGVTYTARQVKALLNSGSRVLFIPGQDKWVELSEADYATLNALIGGGVTKLSRGDVIAIAKTGKLPPHLLPEDLTDLIGVQTTGTNHADQVFLEELRTSDGFEVLQEKPPGFGADLAPFQLRGVSWMDFMTKLGFGACLADEMGLGKTRQALALVKLKRLQQQNDNSNPVLVVVPIGLLSNWRREIREALPDFKIGIHAGESRAKNLDDLPTKVNGKDVVLVSYDVLARDAELLAQVKWSGMVLDEAQMLKNAETDRYEQTSKIGADWKVALTGRPIENNLGELWAIMHFLNPYLLGDAQQFNQRYVAPLRDGLQILDRLREEIRPYILRRGIAETEFKNDIPPKTSREVRVGLTPEQIRLYDAAVERFRTRIDVETADGKEANQQRLQQLAFSLITELKLICNHPGLLSLRGLGKSVPGKSVEEAQREENNVLDNMVFKGRSQKFDQLADDVHTIMSQPDQGSGEEKIIIFTQYTKMGKILERFFANTYGADKVGFFHGNLTLSQRDKISEAFQQETGGPRILVVSTKAGGVGLNLFRANHVFHYDRLFNPAAEDQATARAHRKGQTREVNEHKYITAGTLEEKIAQLLAHKDELARILMASDGCDTTEWLAGLAPAELVNHLSRSRPPGVCEAAAAESV